MKRTLAGLTAVIAVTAALGGAPTSAVVPAGPTPLVAPRCATAVLPRAMPAKEALPRLSTGQQRLVARRGDSSRAQLEKDATDASLWLDRCGEQFYVEPSGHTSATAPATPLAAGEDVFTLSSRPGASRTVFLDFRGGVVTNTAWNAQYGSTITAEPYSLTAPVDTAFSDQEKAEIRAVWEIVAEDYAPFDVNVTTQDPGAAALARSSSADSEYGTRIMVTNGGPISASCSCGGVAYVDVFGTVDATGYYAPGWVFAQSAGGTAKGIGEAASHEAGHTLGLHHDGTSTAGYYTGSAPWAPIMGAGYYQPMSQWSRGEFPDANNREDDISVITSKVPVVADDFGDNAQAATALNQGESRTGLISTAADVDAFSLSATDLTTVRVTPTSRFPDVDLQLRVVREDGTTVATVDPPVAKSSAAKATGLDASWTGMLPAADPTQLTLLVEGVGSGNPATAGQYSDYASLGGYTISVMTGVTATTLVFTPATPPGAVAAQPYTASVGTVESGTAPYVWSATGLPAGLQLTQAGTLSGAPVSSGTYSVSVLLTDAAGATATHQFTLVVAPAGLRVGDQTIAGTAGQSVSRWLSATGGAGGYSWRSTGLPGGLSLTANGYLSGIPTAAGTTTATVTVTSDAQTATATLTFVITAVPTLMAQDASLTTPVKKAIRLQLVASGGAGSYRWTTTGLPKGLKLSTAGLVTGSLATAGTYTLPVTVESAGARYSPTVTVVATWVPVRTAAAVTVTGLVARGVSRKLTASYGDGTYQWSSASLPAGLSLTPAGLLTGTTGTAGVSTFPATVTSANTTATVIVTVKLSWPAIQVAAPPLSSIPLGDSVTTQLTATGGDGTTYQWSGNKLPAWAAITPTGLLTATPIAGGSFSLSVTATSGGLKKVAAVRLKVAWPMLVANDRQLSQVAGTPITAQLTATGGDSKKYTWSGSRIPMGVRMTSAGVVTSNILLPGTYAYVATVSSGGYRVPITVTIAVSSPVVTRSLLALSGWSSW